MPSFILTLFSIKNKNKNKNIYLSSLGMYKHKMGKQARYKIFDF